MTTDDRAARAPKVSVVIPTHNRPVWLGQALGSVLTGEFRDLEVVVSNNGDPEHTRSLARTVTDPRVRWVEQRDAAGLAENLVAGMALARGEYVALLDDDDWWTPGYLAALVPALDRDPGTVVSFGDHHVVGVDGVLDPGATDRCSRRFGRHGLPAGPHRPFFGLVARQTLSMICCVFRRDAVRLDDFPAELGPFIDIWMTYQLAAAGGSAQYHDERLMYYRSHPTSASSVQRLPGYLTAISYRRRMLDDPRMAAHRPVLRERLARDHLSAGAALLRDAARADARAHLTAAARLRPHWKSIGGIAATWMAPRSVLNRL